MTEQVWRDDQRTRRPFCQQAGIKPLGSSWRLQRALTDFGADEAFAPAAAKVQEHYGVTVSVDRVRRTTPMRTPSVWCSKLRPPRGRCPRAERR